MNVKRSIAIVIAMIGGAVACHDSTADLPPTAQAVLFAARRGVFPSLTRLRDSSRDPVDVGEVGQIAVSPSGVTALFRLDTAGLVLDTYAPSGDRLGTIARHGQGPGEFRLQGFLAFVGDTLVVVSPGRPAILRFLASGRFIGEARVSGGFGAGIAVGRGEVYYAEYGRGGVVGIGAVSIATGVSRRVLSRANEFFRTTLSADSGSRTVPPALAVDSGILYLGRGRDYRIGALDSTGALLAQFGRTLRKGGRGPRGLGQMRAALELAVSEPSPGIDDIRARRDTLEREIIPFFGRGSFAVDGAGRLWVAVRQGDTTVLDVFAGTTFLGRHETGCLRSPGGFSLTGRYLALRCAVAPGDEFYSLELFRIDEDSLGPGSR
jgi:hypothetical protein